MPGTDLQSLDNGGGSCIGDAAAFEVQRVQGAIGAQGRCQSLGALIADLAVVGQRKRMQRRVGLQSRARAISNGSERQQRQQPHLESLGKGRAASSAEAIASQTQRQQMLRCATSACARSRTRRIG